jgi:TDG/mug DNA glycosylase family protein
LTAVFCGINPGRFSAAANAHFANPRNDFWRLLHAARFTPRLYDPSEQFELLRLGLGVTNAAYRTTPGSGDLRRGDFAGSAERLQRIAAELRPRAIAFVGKEAYRGAFGERAELGVQARRLGETALWVLPSTSPANAAVPWEERLRWFRAFRESL